MEGPLSPYECYCEYVSIKRHFTDWRYDYERYGPARIRPETFDRRPDVLKFKSLSRRTDPRWTMAAVLARHEGAWVGDMTTAEADEVSNAAAGRLQGLTFHARRELAGRDPRELLSTPAGGHPVLAREVMGGRISPEVGSILVHAAGLVDKWRRDHDGDPVMESVTRRLCRYYTFFPGDRRVLAKTVVQVLRDSL